jgi:outer membrane protein OmpA-like peptidoglycan-associated protein
MRSLMLGVFILPMLTVGGATLAQSDPAARALIQQLLPRTSSDTTRGIRPVGAAPAAVPRAATPAPAAVAVPSTTQPATAQPPAPPRAAAAAPPPAATPRQTTAPEGVSAASITVTFPSGSAELTQDAMAALSPLGRALASSDLVSFRFRIEGHTDSVGPRDANQTLSERRAATVRDYLVRRFGVDASRLEIVGRGEDDPLIPAGDEVAERRNRRVQVVNIGN